MILFLRSEKQLEIMKNKIIVALDGVSVKEALNIASKLKNKVWGFKINDLLFSAEDGEIISKLKKFGKVFADVKLHDVPSTVARSVARLEKAGADLITVHAVGGVEMMKAAKKAVRRTKILGVTLLTSKNTVSKKEFLELIADIKKTKLDGVVCSGHELKYLRPPGLLKVVPGIRPKWYNIKDDQVRTVTPLEAVKLGADLLVIGRPIVKLADPVEAVKRVISEIN